MCNSGLCADNLQKGSYNNSPFSLRAIHLTIWAVQLLSHSLGFFFLLSLSSEAPLSDPLYIYPAPFLSLLNGSATKHCIWAVLALLWAGAETHSIIIAGSWGGRRWWDEGLPAAAMAQRAPQNVTLFRSLSVSVHWCMCLHNKSMPITPARQQRANEKGRRLGLLPSLAFTKRSVSISQKHLSS